MMGSILDLHHAVQSGGEPPHSKTLREIQDGGVKVAPACGVRVLQHRFGLRLAEQPEGIWFMVSTRANSLGVPLPYERIISR
jgi:hypothetical protein